jgi:hypothetical protein
MNSHAVIVDIETAPIEGAEALTEPVSAPANYKQPEAIARYVAEASAAQVAKAALYPWTARIVALGIWPVDKPQHRVHLAPTEAQEADALRLLWALVVDRPSGSVRPIISFNGLGFDMPVLMARSRLLGIDAPLLNLDRYRSPHPDLMQILTFRGAIPARSLTWFAKRFGLPITDETTGADIGPLVQAGNYEAVRAHCTSDLELTHALAVRLGLIRAATPDQVAEMVL